jgi:hypothetical protein
MRVIFFAFRKSGFNVNAIFGVFPFLRHHGLAVALLWRGWLFSPPSPFGLIAMPQLAPKTSMGIPWQ